VRIQGDEVRVRAAVRMLDIYSGHADAKGLVAWAKARGPVSGQVMLAHGEPQALAGLKERLAGAGFAADRILIPSLDEGFALGPAGVLPAPVRPARLLPGAATTPDWHNQRAAFLSDLDRRLEEMPDDAARKALIEALERGLQGRAAAA
jgi:metallo-beta-lactamase family protein